MFNTKNRFNLEQIIDKYARIVVRVSNLVLYIFIVSY